MDINFNGTIITLFGSLPLERLGSQGGPGLAPSSLDVFEAERVQLWPWGMRGEEKEVTGK